jgi:hypothetical protein
LSRRFVFAEAGLLLHALLFELGDGLGLGQGMLGGMGQDTGLRAYRQQLAHCGAGQPQPKFLAVMGVEPKQNPVLFGDISDIELGDHGSVLGQRLQNDIIAMQRL